MYCAARAGAVRTTGGETVRAQDPSLAVSLVAWNATAITKHEATWRRNRASGGAPLLADPVIRLFHSVPAVPGRSEMEVPLVAMRPLPALRERTLAHVSVYRPRLSSMRVSEPAIRTTSDRAASDGPGTNAHSARNIVPLPPRAEVESE
jgi:hypothetical protein